MSVLPRRFPQHREGIKSLERPVTSHDVSLLAWLDESTASLRQPLLPRLEYDTMLQQKNITLGLQMIDDVVAGVGDVDGPDVGEVVRTVDDLVRVLDDGAVSEVP